jgi:hypothetical protein
MLWIHSQHPKEHANKFLVLCKLYYMWILTENNHIFRWDATFYFLANITPWDKGLGCDTSSWCGRHLCQIILKSFNAWQCYSLQTNLYLQTLRITISTFKLLELPWPWRKEHGSYTQHVIFMWLTFVSSYFKTLQGMTKLWSGHECVYL